MEDSHPLSGSTIAFETRYEVRIQVLSSWPAERLPAMCGRATLAMEVSSTSMKVASVTVTAMIHGLMLPSGVRNFASSLFFMTVPSAFLFRHHRGVGVHARPQNGLVRGNRVENDLHGNALDHLY